MTTDSFAVTAFWSGGEEEDYNGTSLVGLFGTAEAAHDFVKTYHEKWLRRNEGSLGDWHGSAVRLMECCNQPFDISQCNTFYGYTIYAGVGEDIKEIATYVEIREDVVCEHDPSYIDRYSDF